MHISSCASMFCSGVSQMVGEHLNKKFKLSYNLFLN